MCRISPGGPQNIGILNGEPSRNEADVDLDCPEAVRCATAFLPYCIIFG